MRDIHRTLDQSPRVEIIVGKRKRLLPETSTDSVTKVCPFVQHEVIIAKASRNNNICN